MYCEEIDFSELVPIKLNAKSAKLLESDFLENFYEVALKSSYPEPEEALCFLAERYLQKEQYDKGVDILESLVHLEPDNPLHYYRLACLYSCLKKKEKALQSLKFAIKLGFHDKDKLITDEALEFIRQEKEFQRLIEKLENF